MVRAGLMLPPVRTPKPSRTPKPRMQSVIVIPIATGASLLQLRTAVCRSVLTRKQRADSLEHERAAVGDALRVDQRGTSAKVPMNSTANAHAEPKAVSVAFNTGYALPKFHRFERVPSRDGGALPC
jgi:hypothetical protein